MLSGVRSHSRDRKRTEKVLATAPLQFRDTAVLPVLDALYRPLPVIAQGTSKRGGAAQLFDQFGVGMEFVHARQSTLC